MIRPIKFRAYYQKITNDEWIIEGEYTLRDLTDRGIQFYQVSIDWVEFTGLKDSKGNEIYEGDIIQRVGHDYKHEIKWCSQSCGFNLAWIFDSIRAGWDVEIIGNIHQDPEMVKQND